MALRGVRRLAAAVTAACLLCDCSSPEDRFSQHFERAGELAAEGNIEAAELEYLSALKIDPTDFEANHRLGELLMALGDPNAVFYLEAAVDSDPDRIDVAAALARVLMVTGRRDEARELIESCLSARPDSAEALAAQSELYLYDNDAEQALQAASKATTVAPESSSAWMQLGRAYQARIRSMQHQGKRLNRRLHRKAAAAFARADELAGGLVLARIEKARTVGARIQSRAQAEFQAAIDLAEQQGDADLHMLAANAALQFAVEADKVEMQIWALEEILKADDSRLDVWRRLARLSASVGRSDDDVYAALIEKRPDDPGAHVLYARHLVNHDRTEAAVKHLEGMIERDLGSAAIWEQLIRLQIHLRQIAEARATFVRMWKKFPADPLTRQANARLALAVGRFADASKILQTLADRSEGYETHRLLAVAEYRDGDLFGASTAIDRALELSPDFAPDVVRFKAQVHYDAREWKKLLQTLNLLVQNGVGMLDFDWLMRARALYNLDRPDRGRAALMHLLSKPDPPIGAVLDFAKWEGDAQPEAATAYLMAAREQRGDEPEILEALVDLDLRAGHLEQALARLNASFDKGDAVPRTVLLRASIHRKLGALEAAEADALRALESNPSVPGGIDLLYAIYEDQGRLEEARKSFEAAESAGVLRASGRLLLGRIYAREGDTKRAMRMYESTLEEDPTVSVAKRELAYLLAERNQDLDRALRLAKEAYPFMALDVSAADTLGFVYLRNGLNEAALVQFRRALDLNKDQPSPHEPMLHYHMGLTLGALDRNDEAADAFRRALAIDPNFPRAADARRRIEAAAESVTAAPSPS